VRVSTPARAGLAVGRDFKLRDLRAALPGISDPTFRIALTELRREREARVDGTGQGAIWSRTQPWPDDAP
jgi:hypothetical protein